MLIQQFTNTAVIILHDYGQFDYMFMLCYEIYLRESFVLNKNCVEDSMCHKCIWRIFLFPEIFFLNTHFWILGDFILSLSLMA